MGAFNAEEGALAVGARALRGPVRAKVVPSRASIDTRTLKRSRTNSCHMEPAPAPETIIVAAFRREDLVRLHTLLACYESPFRSSTEGAARVADERSHHALRQYLAALLY